MATQNIYENYKTATVNTTDQGKLILICYDVAIKNCQQAKEMIEHNQLQDKAKRLYKAQDAITELMVSLSMEKGGEFSKRLYSLYEYFNWRLSEANIKQSVPMIEEVLRHLKSLRDAWVIAIEKVRKEKAAATSFSSSPALSAAPAVKAAPMPGTLRLVG